MMLSILKTTPLWVWSLLAALTWLGLSQARVRTTGLARVTAPARQFSLPGSWVHGSQIESGMTTITAWRLLNA